MKYLGFESLKKQSLLFTQPHTSGSLCLTAVLLLEEKSGLSKRLL
jgi:hypothetical protein